MKQISQNAYLKKINPPLSVTAYVNTQSALPKSNCLIHDVNLTIASLLLQKF